MVWAVPDPEPPLGHLGGFRPVTFDLVLVVDDVALDVQVRAVFAIEEREPGVRCFPERPHHVVSEGRKDMNWSRLRSQSPGSRHLPRDDQPPKPAPLLTRPFEAGLTGWIVVFGAVIAELAGGAAVANQPSAAIAIPVLVFPVVVVFGFALVQWWQVRSSGAEPAGWWHLGGIAAGVLIWLLWPTVPGALGDTTVLSGPSSGRAFCTVLPAAAAADCLHRTAQAFDNHGLAWWCTGVLILIAALLARRSRIAAWGAIPAALAGCQLATYFLNQIVLYYHLGA